MKLMVFLSTFLVFGIIANSHANDEREKQKINLNVDMSFAMMDQKGQQFDVKPLSLSSLNIDYRFVFNFCFHKSLDGLNISEDEKDSWRRDFEGGSFGEKYQTVLKFTNRYFDNESLQIKLMDHYAFEDDHHYRLAESYYNYLSATSDYDRSLALAPLRNESVETKLMFVGKYIDSHTYDSDLVPKLDHRGVSIEEMNQTILKEEGDKGVCDSWHSSAVLIARELGLDHSFLVAYSTYSGGHSVARIDDVENNKVAILNWGEVRVRNAGLDEDSYVGSKSIPVVGTNIKVFAPESFQTSNGTEIKAKSVGTYDLPLGNFLNEASGVDGTYLNGSHELKSKMNSVEVDLSRSGSFKFFTGKTSDQAVVGGLSYNKEIKAWQLAFVLFTAEDPIDVDPDYLVNYKGSLIRFGHDKKIQLFKVGEKERTAVNLDFKTRGKGMVAFASTQFADMSDSRAVDTSVDGQYYASEEAAELYFNYKGELVKKNGTMVDSEVAMGDFSYDQGVVVDGDLTSRVGVSVDQKIGSKATLHVGVGQEIGVGVANVMYPIMPTIFPNRTDANIRLDYKSSSENCLIESASIGGQYIEFNSLPFKTIQMSGALAANIRNKKDRSKIKGFVESTSFTNIASGLTGVHSSCGIVMEDIKFKRSKDLVKSLKVKVGHTILPDSDNLLELGLKVKLK